MHHVQTLIGFSLIGIRATVYLTNKIRVQHATASFSRRNIRVCDSDFRSAVLNPKCLYIIIVEVVEDRRVCVRWSRRGVNLVSEERHFGEGFLTQWRASPGG